MSDYPMDLDNAEALLAQANANFDQTERMLLHWDKPTSATLTNAPPEIPLKVGFLFTVLTNAELITLVYLLVGTGRGGEERNMVCTSEVARVSRARTDTNDWYVHTDERLLLRN